MGTAQFWSNFPPKELKNINANAQSNGFYWIFDEKGTLVAQWMDNGLVFCMSTVHCPEKTIKRICKKLRITVQNKGHVEEILGNEGTVEISIPELIDNYKH